MATVVRERTTDEGGSGQCLGDFVDGEVGGVIFQSGSSITSERHVYYQVDSFEGGGILRVVPCARDGDSYVVEDYSVGLLYRQHEGDAIVRR